MPGKGYVDYEDRQRLPVEDRWSARFFEVEKVFEPFFSTEVPKKTGLGLSITQSIIQSHGGSIGLIEAPKATFKILLPFHEKKEEGP